MEPCLPAGGNPRQGGCPTGKYMRRIPACLTAQLAAGIALQTVAAAFCASAHAIGLAQVRSMYARAHSALLDRRFQQALAEYEVLAKISPDSPEVLLGLERCELGLGRRKAALALFARVISQGLGGSLLNDADFLSLQAEAGYATLLAEATREAQPIVTAKAAFTLADRTLIPEGLAYDQSTARFFASSTYRRKIVVRARDGRYRDFVRTADHGLWQALGLKVDARRGWLVVCSGADSASMIGFEAGDLGKSAVFIYDLRSARLVARYDARLPGQHLFNDLVIGPHGAIYITDSAEGSVYRLDVTSHRLQRLTSAGALLYPNGITMSPDGSLIYVADEAVGIDLVDPSTGAVRHMPHPRDVSTVGIDGLYFHDDQLIATQTDTRPNRVMAFHLTPMLDAIAGSTVLERGDPRMSSPTEGVLVGGRLFFIANSQQADFDRRGRIFADSELSRTRVLALRIPPARRTFPAPARAYARR